jgi:hypothetical protein
MSIDCRPHARPTAHFSPETAHCARLDCIGLVQFSSHLSQHFQTLPL